jgi:hypothetical protein
VFRGFGMGVMGVALGLFLIPRVQPETARPGIGLDDPAFAHYARAVPCRAGATGSSMITGCSPRYSRVTARDHDFSPHRIPQAGMEEEDEGTPAAPPW